MALLEYISRYRSPRMQVCKGHPTKLARHALVVFALISLIAISLSINSAYCDQGDWLNVTLGVNPDNFITDSDGSLYLASDYYIYKYSKNLEFLTSTQPTVQSKKSPNEVSVSKDTNNTSQQFKNKLLRIVKSPLAGRLGKPDLLLSCWQIQNLVLKCCLFRLNDLNSIFLDWTSVKFIIEDNEDLEIAFSGYDSGHMLFLTSRPSSSLEQLEHVIDFHDGNQTSIRETRSANRTYSMPAMGMFRAGLDQATRQIKLELTEVLPYNKQLSENLLLYQYIYTFTSGNHTYFVLNDIQKLNYQSTNVVRLARICQNDQELTSYTEIPLGCKKKDDLYARTAFLDDSKSSEDTNLHVISEDISGKSPASHMCSYSFKHIQDLFNKAIADCHEGFINSYMLRKLHPPTDKPLLCQKNPTKDWCLTVSNPYIDGSNYAVTEYNYILLEGLTSSNFFYAAHQGRTNGTEVYFIGTRAGQLAKITSQQEPLYSIDLYDGQIENYRPEGEKISNMFKTRATLSQRNAMYSISGSDIYATTTHSNKLHKISTVGCQFYTSCGACITSRDPLNCVWCSDKCVNENKCTTGEPWPLLCPPIIESFHPQVGTTTGITKLNITGDNFGTKRGGTRVMVANQECQILEISKTKISCNLPPQNESSAIISIEVDDEINSPPMKGKALSRNKFNYAKVSIDRCQPFCVPKTGPTNVTILGKNLNAGSERKVLFDDLECQVLDVSYEQLNCSLNSNLLRGRKMLSNFTIVVDNIQYTAPETASNNQLTKADIDCIDSLEAPDDQALEPDDGSRPHKVILTVILFVTLTIAILYIVLKNGLTQLIEKVIPNSMIDKCDIDGTKMNFRAPNGTQISQQDSTSRPSESLSGLIKLNDLSGEYFNKTDQFDQDKPLMQEVIDDEIMLILRQEKILVERNRLTLGHVLGSGQFGRVYKGFLKREDAGEHETVAVKTLHNRCHWDDSNNHQAFLEEGLMMKDFNHENVLALIGVTFDSNGSPMVITPFMLYGDLRSYISDEASTPTVKELIDFGIQVAKGMAYLSNLKFVHRDLAARNCMLDENLIVKVADFGLSRDIYERDYYSSDNKKAKLPVKWMAIESLERSIYSTKTDVWSFGVLLWELMTRGVVPYPDVDNFDLFSYLKEGRRMLRPRYCPMSLYKIMLACWKVDPEDRPTFDELVVSVSNVIVQLQEAKDSNGQQKVSRDGTYCDVVT